MTTDPPGAPRSPVAARSAAWGGSAPCSPIAVSRSRPSCGSAVNAILLTLDGLNPAV